MSRTARKAFRHRVLRHLWVLGTAVALALAMPPLAAQEAGAVTGRITGTDGTPVEGAQVVIRDTGIGASTNQQGRYLLQNVPAGDHTLAVERIGFATREREITVPPGGAVQVDLALDAVAVEVEGVTVIGSPEELQETRERLLEIPGGVSLVEPAELRGTRQVNFKDVLRFTPGVFIQPRFGAADESQLSIRGSGLRNNFHLRGVNILVNGMPYRLADGFTDFESLELLTTESIQVYKGANALRFGGSTLGGAINLETKTGYTAEPVNVFAQGGAFGLFKGQVSRGAVRGDFNYYASYARTDLDGFRDYSAQRRDRVNLQAGYRLSDAVDLRSFYLFAWVEEELPGSLTREQFEANPRAAHPDNVENRHGRDYQLHHLGVQLRAQLRSDERIDVAPYFQYRSIVHPIFRVLDQDSRDWGMEARYRNERELGGRDSHLTLGLQWAWGANDNRHFENEGGEAGALAKRQRDEASSVALYAEEVLSLTPRLDGVLGVRWSRDTRQLDDFFLDDGDQSDDRVFTAIQPKVGMIYGLPSVEGQIFANVSRTYEPPLLLELNSLTVPGFVDVAPQDALQFELGTRGGSGRFEWDVSLYDIEIDDEIINVNVQPFPGAPFTVPSYRNAPRTRHAGVEAGLRVDVLDRVFLREGREDRLALRGSYTWGRFEYVEDPDYEGNRLPGVPAHVLQGELVYRHPSGLTLKPNVEWAPGRYFVDSENSVEKDGWTVFGARGDLLIERLDASLFVEVRNFTDEVYSPAVTVDDGAGRHFLPADGRSLYAGVRWQPGG